MKWKKEVAIAILEANIYYTWPASNWKIFRHIVVNTDFVIVLTQTKIKKG